MHRGAAMARAVAAAVALVFLAAIGTVEAHLSVVCASTHEQRPGAVTFLYGTYHEQPYAGASVPGTAFIKTPQGHTHDFAFNSFCGINTNTWLFDEPMTYYRSRLLSMCVCEKILECGTYNTATGMCTSTTGDCATIDPKTTEIECYKQDDNVPASDGAWAIQKGDDEPGKCAFGSAFGIPYLLTFYTAKVEGIYSGIFEVWSEGSDYNLDPSSGFGFSYGGHPCTMSQYVHVFLPVAVADGGLRCTSAPSIAGVDSECVPSVDNAIISGYVCSSVCDSGEVAVSVYTCTAGKWDRAAKCLNVAVTVTCSASASTQAGTGIIGIDGDGCDMLTAVDTICDIVCADGYWGSGKLECSDAVSSTGSWVKRPGFTGCTNAGDPADYVPKLDITACVLALRVCVRRASRSGTWLAGEFMCWS